MTHPSTFPLRLPLLLCALVLCTIPRSASAAISSYDDVRGRPYTVGWDHRALLINNQRVLLLSGGIHYPRSTPAMWPHLMRELRASGLNAMQSYLFWSYHEVQPGVWDLSSESRNVTAFLDAARDAGVWVNLRMGPYVCGEWSYGGIPVWLRSDFAFRDANAQWLAAMSSFYAHMLPVLEPYLARNGGPIILTQVENEIGIFESTPPSRRQQAYVDWCGAYASALMTDTVWSMCNQMGHPTPANILVPVDCDRCPERIVESRVRQQPAMWAENYPSYYATTMYWGDRPAYGSKSPQDWSYSTAQWFAIGGVHVNYYMAHGGTNFGRHASNRVKTSYDYGAMLDEWALRREPSFTHQTRLHLTLQRYTQSLLLQEYANATTLDDGCRLYNYTAATPTSGVLIVENPASRAASTSLGSLKLTLQGESIVFVDAASMAVVYDTANYTGVGPSTHARDRTNADLPSASATNLSWWAEPLGVWDAAHSLVAMAPLEQINATQYHTRYFWYTTKVSVQSSSTVLGLSSVTDHLHVFLDDEWVLYTDAITSLRSFPLSTNTSSTSASLTLKLLTTSQGLDVFAGAFDQAGVRGAVMWAGVSIAQQTWTHSIGTAGEALQVYTQEGGANVSWSSSTPLSARRHLMWYRLLIPTPAVVGVADRAAWQLDLGSMGKGEVWANGFMLGHYWNITYDGRNPTTRYYHLPTEYLAPVNQSNLVVLLEELGGDPTAITLQQRNATMATAAVSASLHAVDARVD